LVGKRIKRSEVERKGESDNKRKEIKKERKKERGREVEE